MIRGARGTVTKVNHRLRYRESAYVDAIEMQHGQTCREAARGRSGCRFEHIDKAKPGGKAATCLMRPVIEVTGHDERIRGLDTRFDTGVQALQLPPAPAPEQTEMHVQTMQHTAVGQPDLAMEHAATFQSGLGDVFVFPGGDWVAGENGIAVMTIVVNRVASISESGPQRISQKFMLGHGRPARVPGGSSSRQPLNLLQEHDVPGEPVQALAQDMDGHPMAARKALVDVVTDDAQSMHAATIRATVAPRKARGTARLCFPVPGQSRMSLPGLHKFLFDGIPVRGALVRVTTGWQEALRRRAGVGAFPAPVRALLGEMTAAGLLMQSSLKFEGALILQVHGDGPLKLAVAEVRHDYSFRATAKVVSDIPPEAGLAALANPGGSGRCAIILDARQRPKGTPPYQGVVPLHDDDKLPLADFSGVVEHYMLQSEQIDTRMVLAANDDVAAGLLLQRMPSAGRGNLAGRDEDLVGYHEDFNRLTLLAATLSREELLSLEPDRVLHRLFWEEPLQRFTPESVRFSCTCSRERVSRMLEGLGRAELDDILREQGRVEVGCDFCGLQYPFDAVDVGSLFTPAHDLSPPPTGLQ